MRTLLKTEEKLQKHSPCCDVTTFFSCVEYIRHCTIKRWAWIRFCYTSLTKQWNVSYFQVFSQTSSSSSAFNPQLWNLTVLRILTCSFVWPLFRQRHLLLTTSIFCIIFLIFFNFLTNLEKNAKSAQSETDPFIRELIDQKLALSPKERSIKFRKFSSKRNQPISPSCKQCSLLSLYFCVQLRNYVNNITFAINKYYPSQVWGFILDLHSIFVETSLKVNFGMEQ